MARTLAALERVAAEALTDHRAARKAAKAERSHVVRLRQEYADATEAQAVLQAVAKDVQERAHGSIAAVVTRCLHEVFRNGYEFRFVFDKRRGKTEAKPTFFFQGNEVDPKTAAGGGCLDVAAFALRVACVVLSRPAVRRLLVLDEPFKFVNGEEYQARMGAMVESLATDLGLQVVMVSDDDWLKIGKVIEL